MTEPLDVSTLTLGQVTDVRLDCPRGHRLTGLVFRAGLDGRGVSMSFSYAEGQKTVIGAAGPAGVSGRTIEVPSRSRFRIDCGRCSYTGRHSAERLWRLGAAAKLLGVSSLLIEGPRAVR